MRRHYGGQRAEQVKGDEYVSRTAIQVVQFLVHQQQGERIGGQQNERVVGVEDASPGVERVMAIVGQQIGMRVAGQAEQRQADGHVLENELEIHSIQGGEQFAQQVRPGEQRDERRIVMQLASVQHGPVSFTVA